MTQLLELSDKNFKGAIMKCFNKQLQTCLKQMKKVSHRKYKEQSNGNVRTEKNDNQNKKLTGWAQQQNGGYIGKN